MKAPRAVIAEDEANLREQLREVLKEIWPELKVAAEAEDGLCAIRAIDRHSPDILFLDIEMPGMTGLEVARHASGRCHVVFVTAFEKYAIAAFEQGAIDYLMKPISAARVADTVRRLKERAGTAPANLDGLIKALSARSEKERGPLRWISASHGGEMRLITTEEILYLKSDNKYTVVVTAERDFLIRVPIKELLEQLDPEYFWQIHRGTVVNAAHIAGVVRALGGSFEVRIKNRSERLAVSESFAQRFRDL